MSEPSTQWINAEPPILLGLTSSELFRVSGLCLAIWGALSVYLVLALEWSFLLMLFIAPVGAVVSAASIGLWLRKQKRDRPDHYFVHSWQIRWRQALGIQGDLVLRDGWWSVGRSAEKKRRTR